MPLSDPVSSHHDSNAAVTPTQQVPWSNDDDEWEYEYDEEETEDFFLTLDLTTHLPDATVAREVAGNGKQVKGIQDLRLKEFKRLKQTPAETQAEIESPQQDGAAEVEESGLEHDRSTAVQQPVTSKTSQPLTIQLIGLHTTKPYLMFNNTFYTCYWLTDIGTQIWVTRPGVSETAAWSGNVLDIVATSRVRLLAKPAKLEPRYEPESSHVPDPVPQDAASRQTTAFVEPIDGNRPVQQLVVPINSIADPALRAQATFMEKLSALKIRKGEKDQMPLYSVKTYECPPNATEIRSRAWDAEDAKLEASGDNEAMPRLIREPGQPGRKYSKLGARFGYGGAGMRSHQQANAEDQESVIEDENPVTSIPESGGLDADQSLQPFDKASALQKRGPKKRSAKLAALGLTSQDPAANPVEGLPKEKRRRRTKAQMQEARAAEAAAQARKTLELS